MGRWAILRSIMPQRISIQKTVALVVALCKLHNFCIDANDGVVDVVSNNHPRDIVNLRNRSMRVGDGIVDMTILNDEEEQCEVPVPREIMGNGHHLDEFPINYRDRQLSYDGLNHLLRDGHLLPRERLCNHVEQTNRIRPKAPPTY